MGGTHELELIHMIGSMPMPVTKEQLIEVWKDGRWVSAVLSTHTNHGWAIENPDGYTVNDEIMAKAIEEAEKELEFWQQRIEHLKGQSEVLTQRKLTTQT